MNKPELPNFQLVLNLIQEAKARVYAKANSELVLLYFNVGKFVSEKVNAGNWGDNTVQELADYISSKNPELSGFNRRGLYRMKQFFETYNIDSECFKIWTSINKSKMSAMPTQLKNIDNQAYKKVSAVMTQLEKEHQQFIELLTRMSWTNHLEIFSTCKNSEALLYYLLTAIIEKWSMRELRKQINTASFERTRIANAQSINNQIFQHLPQNLFKDPYIFEFLNLPDQHSEKDFESAIVLNLQKFILEVGKGFSYMGRQYRLQVGNKDYYTDLLFYHRDLQCLVLFELKIEDFAPEFLGKLNFYLEALDRNVKRPHEKPSIGILLCKGKDTEAVEYAMARNTSPALIADYETKLIEKDLLANKLHQLAETFTKESE